MNFVNRCRSKITRFIQSGTQQQYKTILWIWMFGILLCWWKESLSCISTVNQEEKIPCYHGRRQCSWCPRILCPFKYNIVLYIYICLWEKLICTNKWRVKVLNFNTKDPDYEAKERENRKWLIWHIKFQIFLCKSSKHNMSRMQSSLKSSDWWG